MGVRLRIFGRVARLRSWAARAALRRVIRAITWAKSKGYGIGRPLFAVGSFKTQFEGNALEFCRFAAGDSRVRAVAVVIERTEADRLRRMGIRAVLRGTWREELLLQTADAVFTVGHLRSDFSVMPHPRAVRVMLWHATPMKAVGKLNKPIPDPIDPYDIVAATSTFTAGIMRACFASEGTSVILSGHPKSDPLLRPAKKATVLGDSLPSPSTRLITYLPTWRHDFAVESGGDFGKNAGPLLRTMSELTKCERFTMLLERRDALFVVKPHLLDDLEQLRELQGIARNRIRYMDPGSVDTTSLLRCSDIVVTDYSGVLTDWLILNKPVVCFTYDYAEYWSNRGSPCFEFRDVFNDFMVFDVSELIERLDRILKDPDFQRDELRRIGDVLHAHRDDDAAKRVVEATLELMQRRRPDARSGIAR